MEKLSPEQLAEVDNRILRGHILPALKHLRDWCGVSLHEAKGLHIERYRELRKNRPGDFAVTDEEYWRGVYG